MRPIRKAELQQQTPHGVVLSCSDGLTCRISFLPDGLARVLFTRSTGLRQPKTWMVLSPGSTDTAWEGRDRLDESVWPTVALTREQDGTAITLRSETLGVKISLNPFRLDWLLPDGRVFLSDRSNMAYMFAQNRDTLAHYIARNPADRYYGLGDKTGKLDLHGRRLRIAMRDSLGFNPERGDPLYKHWPFLITQDANTGTAYGLFYDNAAQAAFDLGAEHDNYYGWFHGYEAEGGDLDYYVLAGPKLSDVTPRFLRLTGGTALPPRWSLGYAQTAMAIADVPDAQAQIEGFIARCAQEDIPVSSFHFGSGYTSIGPRRYVFHWNRDKFPDPVGLLNRFHKAGMKVVANVKPCLLDDHPGYQAADRSGAFVRDLQSGSNLLAQFWDGEGSYIDFTTQAGIDWWQDGMTRAVLGTGIDAAWNDNNEYELWDEAATCGNFGNPTPLELLRPMQSLLMTRASVEAQLRANPTERAFSVTRAGCPGIQRFAQTWSGDNTSDWKSLRWNLRTGLQMSLSGMYNTGHDIGGFEGPVPDAELLIRWTQTGVIHPRFIMNSWKPDGVYNSPWLHEAALPIIRQAIQLRYRLIPYIYSLMHAAASDQTPILQPRWLAFENDPACIPDSDDLMLGSFLLAATVVEPGARTRDVYLPAGPECWFDFYSETMLQSGTTVTLDAPLDRLPLVAPSGAILPMTAEAKDFKRLHDEPTRCVRLFPGPTAGHSQFVLVEDDGISANGAVTRIVIDLHWTAAEVAVSVSTTGTYTMPCDTITFALPKTDTRPLKLKGDAIDFHLVQGPFNP
jgi:alpha-glucosidase